MIKLAEEDVRRLIEVARESNLKIGDEVRVAVERGRSPEFYLGFLTGVLNVVVICRKVIDNLGTIIDGKTHSAVGDFAAENLTVETLQFITMRAAEHTTTAAECYTESLSTRKHASSSAHE